MPSIVLDRSALQACALNDLQRASWKHAIIVSDVLIYEIATDAEVPWQRNLRRLSGIPIRACDWPERYVRDEMGSGVPTRAIVDFGVSRAFCERLRQDSDLWKETKVPPPEIVEFRETEVPQAFRGALASLWETRFAEKFKEFRAYVRARRVDLAAAYVALVPGEQVTDILTDIGREQNAHPGYIPTEGWISYSLYRLQNYLGFYCRYQGNKGDTLGDKTIANAEMDVRYVALLTVADGIVSGDTHLLGIAKAFFPRKLVWRNLQQAAACVPASRKCRNRGRRSRVR